MNQFVLTCCSTADMKKTYFDERQKMCIRDRVRANDGISLTINRGEFVAVSYTHLLEQDVFFMSYAPLPILGLDSCPIRAYAIEGLADFSN